jgi:hypothetical protein
MDGIKKKAEGLIYHHIRSYQRTTIFCGIMSEILMKNCLDVKNTLTCFSRLSGVECTR